MLFNLNKVKKIGMFDKNIFLYLEEIDLCRRLRLKKNKIYICKKANITHLGAKSSNLGLIMKNVETGTGCGQNFIMIKNIIIIFTLYKIFL